jgi:hypothetical protein
VCAARACCGGQFFIIYFKQSSNNLLANISAFLLPKLLPFSVVYFCQMFVMFLLIVNLLHSARAVQQTTQEDVAFSKIKAATFVDPFGLYSSWLQTLLPLTPRFLNLINIGIEW